MTNIDPDLSVVPKRMRRQYRLSKARCSMQARLLYSFFWSLSSSKPQRCSWIVFFLFFIACYFWWHLDLGLNNRSYFRTSFSYFNFFSHFCSNFQERLCTDHVSWIPSKGRGSCIINEEISGTCRPADASQKLLALKLIDPCCTPTPTPNTL